MKLEFALVWSIFELEMLQSLRIEQLIRGQLNPIDRGLL